MASGYPPGMTLRPIESWQGPLTSPRQRSRFGARFSDTLELLDRELRLLDPKSHGYPDTVLQMALREEDFRLDGLPRSTAKPDHPGIVLSISPRRGAPLAFPCDTFTDWKDNLRAVALTLEALRKINRYGVSNTGQQYTGWRAIESGSSVPAAYGAQEAAHLIWIIAEMPAENDPLSRLRSDPDVTKKVVRAAKARAHPDRNGGDSGKWSQVSTALNALTTAGVLA